MAVYALGRGIGDSGVFFMASGLMLAVSLLTAGRIERRWGTGWARSSAHRRRPAEWGT